MALGLLWGIAAAVLVIVEMFTMEFTCLSLALGCLLGAAAAALGLPPAAQLGAVLAGSIAAVGFLSPTLRKRFAPRDTATGLDALPGAEALVIEPIVPPAQGKVKLNGVVWQAIANHPIPAGATVMVTEVEGACLTVLAEGALLAPHKPSPAESAADRPHPQQDMLSN